MPVASPTSRRRASASNVAAQLAHLGAGQVGEEMTAHAVDVDGRGGLERGVARVGEHRQGHPPVGGARRARDKPGAHQAVEPPGQAARRQVEPLGEVAHAQPALGRLGEVHQHGVVALAEPEAGHELRLQRGVDVGRDLDQAPPGPHLVVVQPVDRRCRPSQLQPSGIVAATSKLSFMRGFPARRWVCDEDDRARTRGPVRA